MDNSKCVILTPIYDTPEITSEESFSKLASRGYILDRIYGSTYLDMSRSILASRALKRGFDELMWIDDDMVFDPESVDRLRSLDLPIVCGLYPFRNQTGGIAASLFPGCKEIIFGINGGLIEIEGAATGFLYTRREVYESIRKKFNLPLCRYQTYDDSYPYFHEMIHSRKDQDGTDHLAHMGEDLSFCVRARQCGYRIYADTTIKLGHIGKYIYQWEDMAGPRLRANNFLLRFAQNGKSSKNGESVGECKEFSDSCDLRISHDVTT